MALHRQGKVVVFSQWSRHLRDVAVALDSAGFCHAEKLFGAGAEAQLALSNFNTCAPPAVLLVPLRTCGGAAGLTLTVAHTAVLLEVAPTPSLEQQAIGRLHRIGQTATVEVVRFAAPGTVEEQMLRMQAISRRPRTVSAMRALLNDSPGIPAQAHMK